jgi:hypothetical protein
MKNKNNKDLLKFAKIIYFKNKPLKLKISTLYENGTSELYNATL